MTHYRHRHGDAAGAPGAWVDWLKDQGAKRPVRLGHPRGGEQRAGLVAGQAGPALARAVLLAAVTTDAPGLVERLEGPVFGP